MNKDSFIDEIQRISLIQNRLDHILDDNIPKNKSIVHIIEDIELMNGIATKLIDNVSSGNLKITDEVMNKLNHELRTPMVPILGYSEMLLQGHFGTLNLEQKKRIELIVTNVKQLQQKIESLLDRKTYNIKPTDSKVEHGIKELEQEKIVLKKINELLDKKIREDQSEMLKLNDLLADSEHHRLESDQEKRILGKMVLKEEQKILYLDKKIFKIIAISAVIIGAGFSAYSLHIVELGLQYQVPNHVPYSSNYVIQNLQGDTVDTWVSWNIPKERVLHVHIVNTANLAQDKIDIIKDVIQSTQTVSIDDSLNDKGPKGTSSVYYLGWQGAAAQAYSEPTKLYIPQQFDINGSPDTVGDIELILTNDVNPDGLSGYTKSLVDGNEILKSKITIYQANRIDKSWLAAVVRHEFGHALGLGHSTANEDLMNAMIQTNYPVISECDVDALKGLYNGDKNSKVVCTK